MGTPDDVASVLELAGARLEEALQTADVALFETEARPGTTWISPNQAHIIGAEEPPDVWDARRMLERFHPDERARVAAEMRAAVKSADTLQLEGRLLTRDGRERWIKLSARYLRGPDGRVIRAFGSIHEITARKVLLADLRERMPRLRFLADLSAALASQRTYDGALATFARQVVDGFCDGCSIDVMVGSQHRRVAQAHRLPEKEELLRALGGPHVLPPGARTPVTSVLLEQRTLRLDRYDDASVAEWARHREEGFLDRVRALGVRAAVVVPLRFGDDVIGAVSFLLSEDDRGFDDADVSFAEELTRRGAVALERAHLHSQTEEALRARDSLISTSSHELKTPLTTMRLLVDSMKRGLAGSGPIDRTRVERMVDVTDRAIRRLQRLVDDMLDVSRINAGKVSLQRAPVDLSAVVEEAVDRMRDRLDTSLASVSTELVAGLVGSWDRDRLDQIITNLLTNVMRYAPRSALAISTRPVEGGAELEVADSGPGISRADHERIFQKFERALLPGDGTGLGLGLFITRQLVERHGGQIWVESEPGQGARFLVRLPR